MERYICIHGHFYQPPRENAWLEAIEVQDSAYPYHDWNEKITTECYATNAASRILDEKGRIIGIVNNFAKMSFNLGPTLLAWLADHSADVYNAIIDADAESQRRFSGHGSALAQVYNHIILPLANARDKKTQVLWGIRDFEHRFGRAPEGMWLPETAVDLKTLDALSEQKIRYTILAPRQANRIRRMGEEDWKTVSGGRVDPTMPYIQNLPSGRTIILFFYDGPISRAVGFEGLLNRGETFARRMAEGFSKERTWPQLVHIATDGESYGHHHRYGDMALAYALHFIESNNLARLTNYGEYLERHPPSYEVEIIENTSWSCSHGIERWRKDCGCHAGSHPGWHQQWRAPLREALDWLRDTLAKGYEKKMQSFLKNPWIARDEYIQIILHRSRENVEGFIGRHAVRKLSESDQVQILKLLELQRHTLLMYTSCGWFFDELSGIETVQVMQYAGRAIQLGEEFFGNDIETEFLKRLEKAKSNIPEHSDGRNIFEKYIEPAMVDIKKVAAHYAISSLFEDYPDKATIFCYTVERKHHRSTQAGKTNLASGSAVITSEITGESAAFDFGGLHLGDHNLSCGVIKKQNNDFYQTLEQEIFEAYDKGDIPEVFRMLDQHFGNSLYSIRSLFRDEQRKILETVLEAAQAEALSAYRNLYEHHVPLIRFLKDSGTPPPRALYTAGELVLNSDLRRVFRQEELDHEAIKILIEDAELGGVALDADTLEYTLRKNLERQAVKLRSDPMNLTLLEKLLEGIKLVYALPFDVNLRKIQNVHYDLGQRLYPELKRKTEQRGRHASKWVERFEALGEKLLISFE